MNKIFLGNPSKNIIDFLEKKFTDYLTITLQVEKINVGQSYITFNYKSGTNVMYRMNKGKWLHYTSGSPIYFNNRGDYVLFRGKNVQTDINNHFEFNYVENGLYSVSGSVTSLTDLYGINPNVVLNEACYAYMFAYCSISSYPKLPALKLSKKCYSNMFDNCYSSHIYDIELPATELAELCYNCMFNGFTQIPSVQELVVHMKAFVDPECHTIGYSESINGTLNENHTTLIIYDIPPLNTGKTFLITNDCNAHLKSASDYIYVSYTFDQESYTHNLHLSNEMTKPYTLKNIKNVYIESGSDSTGKGQWIRMNDIVYYLGIIQMDLTSDLSVQEISSYTQKEGYKIQTDSNFAGSLPYDDYINGKYLNVLDTEYVDFTLNNATEKSKIFTEHGKIVAFKKGLDTSAEQWQTVIANDITYELTEDFDDCTLDLTSDFNIKKIYSECLLEGTKLTLANGMQKNIEDITYEDLLLTYDFDEGKIAVRKPIWIMKHGTIGNLFTRYAFETGKTLDVIGLHRVFSLTKNKFDYGTNCIGDTVVTRIGADKIVSVEKVKVDMHNMPKFYNILTEHDFNVYANGFLTSCRLNNMYKISEMKFEKDGIEKHTYSEFKDFISEIDFEKYRISEQTYSVSELTQYVNRLNNDKQVQ